MFSAFQIERDCLVVPVAKDDSLDAIMVGMIQNNTFERISTFEVQEQAGQTKVCYPLAGKQSLREAFPDGLSQAQMFSLLQAWVALLEEADDYMLEIGSLVVDSQYIYIDLETNEIRFLCLPILSYQQPGDIISLLKTLLFSVAYAQNEPHGYLAVLINAMQQPGFDAAALKQLIARCAARQAQPVQPLAALSEEAPPEEAEEALPEEAEEALSEEASPEEAEEALPEEAEEALPEGQVVIDLTPTAQLAFVIQPEQSDALPEEALPEEADTQPDFEDETQLQCEVTPYTGFTRAYTFQPDGTMCEHEQYEGAAQMQQTPAALDPEQLLGRTASDTQVEYVGADQGVVLISYDLKDTPVLEPVSSQMPPEVNTANVNFGETAVLNGYAPLAPAEKVETAVLSQKDLYHRANPHLVQQRTGAKVAIFGERFTLGKERSRVNYAVVDNSNISREHAAIITRQNEYFLMDSGSTNGSYLNDEMVQCGVERKIKHGTKIKLADEAFTFYER